MELRNERVSHLQTPDRGLKQSDLSGKLTMNSSAAVVVEVKGWPPIFFPAYSVNKGVLQATQTFLSSLFVAFSISIISGKRKCLLLYLLIGCYVGCFGRSFSCKSESVSALNSDVSFEATTSWTHLPRTAQDVWLPLEWSTFKIHRVLTWSTFQVGNGNIGLRSAKAGRR